MFIVNRSSKKKKKILNFIIIFFYVSFAPVIVFCFVSLQQKHFDPSENAPPFYFILCFGFLLTAVLCYMLPVWMLTPFN